MIVGVASLLGSGAFIIGTSREQSLQGAILHQLRLCLSFKIAGFVLLPLMMYTVKLRCQNVWKALSYIVLNLSKAYWLPDAQAGLTFNKTGNVRLT